MAAVFLLWAGSGCGKKRAAPPPPPPPPSLVERAISLESAGDLTAAAALYEQVLANPAEPGQEEARFRLGLLRARLGEPTFDPEAAESLLGSVAGEGTGARPAEAALILGLLRELRERTEELEALRAELESEGAERTRLQTQLEESRRRLQQVTDELQKLKDIDRERRLRRP